MSILLGYHLEKLSGKFEEMNIRIDENQFCRLLEEYVAVLKQEDLFLVTKINVIFVNVWR